MPEKTVKKKNSEPSAIGKLYLLAYNGVQTVGWSYLMYQTVTHFFNRRSLDSFWPEIKWTVFIFQNAAILEVLHAAIRLVPSGVFVTLAQVYSRVFLVWGSLLISQGAQTSPGLPLAIIAWSITEIIRYGYYALNLVKIVPSFLLTLRYSTFLLLYPIGVTGELLCMYYSLPEIAEKKIWTVSMPNSYNFIFNYHYFIMFYMFLYLPLFPILFGHMMAQRKKMLGKDVKKTK